MTAVALALHIFGAVVWVGGMFAIYVCLRPALGTLEPPQHLRLMRVTFEKFFPWVWLAILLLLASGYNRFGDLRRSTLSWCRRTRISAPNGTRDQGIFSSE